MERMVVVLEWDDEQLGKRWMNIDNLKLCLFNDNFSTRSEFLRVEEVTDIVRDAINNLGVPTPEYPMSVVVAYKDLLKILGEEAV